MRILKTAAIGVATVGLGFALTGCLGEDGKQGDSRESEKSAKSQGYDQMVKNQPAIPMKWSPTRETIKFWIKTWEQENKLSYVYLQSSNGDVIGYYVLKGLPVSYCAMLTPPEEIRDKGDNGRTSLLTQAPSMDGVFYADGGTLCSTYYGQDATSDAYLEWTVGMGINVLLYDQPMSHPSFSNATPLGDTVID
jgi:hypothetical protein